MLRTTEKKTCDTSYNRAGTAGLSDIAGGAQPLVGNNNQALEFSEVCPPLCQMYVPFRPSLSLVHLQRAKVRAKKNRSSTTLPTTTAPTSRTSVNSGSKTSTRAKQGPALLYPRCARVTTVSWHAPLRMHKKQRIPAAGKERSCAGYRTLPAASKPSAACPCWRRCPTVEKYTQDTAVGYAPHHKERMKQASALTISQGDRGILPVDLDEDSLPPDVLSRDERYSRLEKACRHDAM